MKRQTRDWWATAWLGLLLFCALSASWLPVDPTDFDVTSRLKPPNWQHLFGTTRLGEDIFAQCIHGTRVTLLVGVGAPLVAAIIGLPLGVVAGFLGGRVDFIVSLLLDTALAMPAFIVSIVLVTAFGASIATVIAVVGIISAPFVARVSRTAARAIADRPYVMSARSLGATSARIMWVDLRPNLASPIASLLILVGGAAVLVEGGLSYIGLGVPLENASWGRLVASGRSELATAWWWSFIPSLLFFVTVLSVNVLSDRWQRSSLPLPQSARARRSGFDSVARGQTSNAALIVSGLAVSVSSSTSASSPQLVRSFSIRIDTGELVALVGPSGTGKTTIARAVCGVLDDRMVATGAIETAHTGGRSTALIMQEPRRSLDPVTRIGSQIAEPARVHCGLSRRDAQARAMELLALVGIDDPARRMRCYPHDLSGGQCQRVAIALALACEPAVLVADEPTASLDPIATKMMFDVFDEVRRRTGVAILVITHDIASARTRADRLVEIGSTAVLF
jgi:peptide/nickel transport system permease protein